jgi:hypothetical protein
MMITKEMATKILKKAMLTVLRPKQFTRDGRYGALRTARALHLTNEVFVKGLEVSEVFSREVAISAIEVAIFIELHLNEDSEFARELYELRRRISYGFRWDAEKAAA